MATAARSAQQVDPGLRVNTRRDGMNFGVAGELGLASDIGDLSWQHRGSRLCCRLILSKHQPYQAELY